MKFCPTIEKNPDSHRVTHPTLPILKAQNVSLELPTEICLLNDEICEYDVICGRSRLSWSNTGNRRFRGTIALYVNEYSKNTERYERSRVIQKIINLIRDSGGRFLKFKDGSWTELDESLVRHKVGHALRDAALAFRETLKVSDVVTAKRSLHSKKNEIGTKLRFSSNCSQLQRDLEFPSLLYSQLVPEENPSSSFFKEYNCDFAQLPESELI